MNKAEKKFRVYAILVIFVLLTALLTVINGTNFTMASEDADKVTQRIADKSGSFEHGANTEKTPTGMETQPRKKDFRMGPLGPDSPEMDSSLRYFTVSFSDNGKAVNTVAFHISAVTESEAEEWASGLVKQKTGWTRATYRYRVYKKDGVVYVTVIDQGRELLPSYRTLIISAVGEILILIIAWFALAFIAKRIYLPIEEADRKQRNFINNANKEFRVPLTVISGNTELVERKYGSDDFTCSTRRQIDKLKLLVDKLGTIGLYESEDSVFNDIPISEYLEAALDGKKKSFDYRSILLTRQIDSDISVKADPEAIKRMIDEIVDNTQKYALTKAEFKLTRENDYVIIEVRNDTDLSDGNKDSAFDRFTVLENAEKGEKGVGLGLSYVKDVVKAHNGRVGASVTEGVFTLRITLCDRG